MTTRFIVRFVQLVTTVRYDVENTFTLCKLLSKSVIITLPNLPVRSDYVTNSSIFGNQLSRDARIALVLEIWDSIAAESPPSLLTDAHREELRRRIAEDNANPDYVIPWEQVKAQTLARLKP